MIAQIIPAKRGTLRLAMFDYLVPAELESVIKPGQLVLIPLRSKDEFGVIFKLTDIATIDLSRLKSLKSIVNEAPILSQAQLAFLIDMAELYHTSLGYLLKNNLIPLQKRKLKTLIAPTVPHAPQRNIQKPVLFSYGNVAEKKAYLEKIIDPKQQTAIIVAEVHEAKRVKKLLPEELQKHCIIITSEQSVKETFENWVAVWRGEKTIIIGTRSALFLPYFDLFTIIIDNEGNDSHKSWDAAPRFHAREGAFILAKHHGSAVHLISHTPSVESYYFAKHGVYETATTLLPTTETKKFHIRNVRDERRGGNYMHISTDVLEAIQQQRGSIFLFCHRRGTMSHVSCRDCGNVLVCPRCTRSLTYHHHIQALMCHHCGYGQKMIVTCQKCNGMNIALFGAGTDAIAGQLAKVLPNEKRPIITIDQDKDTVKLPDGDAIYVGTHYAWSSIPWEKIQTMVFVDADTPLFIPEYRLAERLWNEMRDANYLLPDTAELFIQTTHPEHTVFTSLYEPEKFYETELFDRRVFKYPPYQYLLKIFIGGMSETKSKTDIDKLYLHLEKLTDMAKNCTITKPFALSPLLQKGQFWHAILIKIPYSSYKKYWKQIVAALPETCKVDPNPQSIFSL